MILLDRRGADDAVAWITIDRPHARNAMTFAMWERLRAVALELDADNGVRAVVIAGSRAEAFVSGTDIAEFSAFSGGDDGVAYEARIAAVIAAVEAIRVPVIAAVAGACTGGGVSIAAACDVRLGAANARVGIPIARTLGNCISLHNLARVVAIVGEPNARALLLTGRLLDAHGARAAGFFTELVDADGAADPATAVHARALALAEQIVALAPLTLRASKEMLRRLRTAGPLPEDDDLIRLCYGSADFRAGVAAFLDKRTPRWTGT